MNYGDDFVANSRLANSGADDSNDQGNGNGDRTKGGQLADDMSGSDSDNYGQSSRPASSCGESRVQVAVQTETAAGTGEMEATIRSADDGEQRLSLTPSGGIGRDQVEEATMAKSVCSEAFGIRIGANDEREHEEDEEDEEDEEESKSGVGQLVLNVDFAPPRPAVEGGQESQATRPPTLSANDDGSGSNAESREAGSTGYSHLVELSLCIRQRPEEETRLVEDNGRRRPQQHSFNCDCEQRDEDAREERGERRDKSGERKLGEGHDDELCQPQSSAAIGLQSGRIRSTCDNIHCRPGALAHCGQLRWRANSNLEAESEGLGKQGAAAGSAGAQVGRKQRLVYERIDKFSLDIGRAASSSSSSLSTTRPAQQQPQPAKAMLPFKSGAFDACFCFNLLNIRVASGRLLSVEQVVEPTATTSEVGASEQERIRHQEQLERDWLKMERLTTELRLGLLSELSRVVKSKGKIMVTVFAYECHQQRNDNNAASNGRAAASKCKQQQPSREEDEELWQGEQEGSSLLIAGRHENEQQNEKSQEEEEKEDQEQQGRTAAARSLLTAGSSKQRAGQQSASRQEAAATTSAASSCLSAGQPAGLKRQEENETQAKVVMTASNDAGDEEDSCCPRCRLESIELRRSIRRRPSSRANFYSRANQPGASSARYTSNQQSSAAAAELFARRAPSQQLYQLATAAGLRECWFSQSTQSCQEELLVARTTTPPPAAAFSALAKPQKDDDHDVLTTCDTIQQLIERTQAKTTPTSLPGSQSSGSRTGSTPPTSPRGYSAALWRVVGGANASGSMGSFGDDLLASSTQHFQLHRDSISEAAKRLGRRLSIGGSSLLGKLFVTQQQHDGPRESQTRNQSQIGEQEEEEEDQDQDEEKGLERNGRKTRQQRKRLRCDRSEREEQLPSQQSPGAPLKVSKFDGHGPIGSGGESARDIDRQSLLVVVGDDEQKERRGQRQLGGSQCDISLDKQLRVRAQDNKKPGELYDNNNARSSQIAHQEPQQQQQQQFYLMANAMSLFQDSGEFAKRHRQSIAVQTFFTKSIEVNAEDEDEPEAIMARLVGSSSAGRNYNHHEQRWRQQSQRTESQVSVGASEQLTASADEEAGRDTANDQTSLGREESFGARVAGGQSFDPDESPSDAELTTNDDSTTSGWTAPTSAATTGGLETSTTTGQSSLGQQFGSGAGCGRQGASSGSADKSLAEGSAVPIGGQSARGQSNFGGREFNQTNTESSVCGNISTEASRGKERSWSAGSRQRENPNGERQDNKAKCDYESGSSNRADAAQTTRANQARTEPREAELPLSAPPNANRRASSPPTSTPTSRAAWFDGPSAATTSASAADGSQPPYNKQVLAEGETARRHEEGASARRAPVTSFGVASDGRWVARDPSEAARSASCDQALGQLRLSSRASVLAEPQPGHLLAAASSSSSQVAATRTSDELDRANSDFSSFTLASTTPTTTTTTSSRSRNNRREHQHRQQLNLVAAVAGAAADKLLASAGLRDLGSFRAHQASGRGHPGLGSNLRNDSSASAAALMTHAGPAEVAAAETGAAGAPELAANTGPSPGSQHFQQQHQQQPRAFSETEATYADLADGKLGAAGAARTGTGPIAAAPTATVAGEAAAPHPSGGSFDVATHQTTRQQPATLIGCNQSGELVLIGNGGGSSVGSARQVRSAEGNQHYPQQQQLMMMSATTTGTGTTSSQATSSNNNATTSSWTTTCSSSNNNNNNQHQQLHHHSNASGQPGGAQRLSAGDGSGDSGARHQASSSASAAMAATNGSSTSTTGSNATSNNTSSSLDLQQQHHHHQLQLQQHHSMSNLIGPKATAGQHAYLPLGDSQQQWAQVGPAGSGGHESSREARHAGPGSASQQPSATSGAASAAATTTAGQAQQQQWCHSNTFSSSINSDISTSGGPKETTEKDSSRRTSTLSGISSIYQQEISWGLATGQYSCAGSISTPANSQANAAGCSNMGSIPELSSVGQQQPQFHQQQSYQLQQQRVVAPPTSTVPSSELETSVQRTFARRISESVQPNDSTNSNAAFRGGGAVASRTTGLGHAHLPGDSHNRLSQPSFGELVSRGHQAANQKTARQAASWDEDDEAAGRHYSSSDRQQSMHKQQQQQQQQSGSAAEFESSSINLQRVAQSLRSQLRERLSTMRPLNAFIGLNATQGSAAGGGLDQEDPLVAAPTSGDASTTAGVSGEQQLRAQQLLGQQQAGGGGESSQVTPGAQHSPTPYSPGPSSLISGGTTASQRTSRTETPTPATLRSFFRSTSSAAFNAFASSFQASSSVSTPTASTILCQPHQPQSATQSHHQHHSLSSDVFDDPSTPGVPVGAQSAGLVSPGSSGLKFSLPSSSGGGDGDSLTDQPAGVATANIVNTSSTGSANSAAAATSASQCFTGQSGLRSPLSPISVTSTRFFARIRDKFSLSPTGASPGSAPASSAGGLSRPNSSMSTSTPISVSTSQQQQQQRAAAAAMRLQQQAAAMGSSLAVGKPVAIGGLASFEELETPPTTSSAGAAPALEAEADQQMPIGEATSNLPQEAKGLAPECMKQDEEQQQQLRRRRSSDMLRDNQQTSADMDTLSLNESNDFTSTSSSNRKPSDAISDDTKLTTSNEIVGADTNSTGNTTTTSTSSSKRCQKVAVLANTSLSAASCRQSQQQQQEPANSRQMAQMSAFLSANKNLTESYEDYEHVVSGRRPSFQRQLDEQVNQVYRMAVERKLQNSPIATMGGFDLSGCRSSFAAASDAIIVGGGANLTASSMQNSPPGASGYLSYAPKQQQQQFESSSSNQQQQVAARYLPPGCSDLESIIRPVSSFLSGDGGAPMPHSIYLPSQYNPEFYSHPPLTSVGGGMGGAMGGVGGPAAAATKFVPAGTNHYQPAGSIFDNRQWIESSQQSIDSSSSARSLRSCWFSMPELYAMNCDSSSQSPSSALYATTNNQNLLAPANNSSPTMDELLSALTSKLGSPDQQAGGQQAPNQLAIGAQAAGGLQHRPADWPSNQLYKQVTGSEGHNWSLSDLNLTSDDIAAPNLLGSSPAGCALVAPAAVCGQEQSRAAASNPNDPQIGSSRPIEPSPSRVRQNERQQLANKQPTGNQFELIKCSTLDDSVCASMKSNSSSKAVDQQQEGNTGHQGQLQENRGEQQQRRSCSATDKQLAAPLQFGQAENLENPEQVSRPTSQNSTTSNTSCALSDLNSSELQEVHGQHQQHQHQHWPALAGGGQSMTTTPTTTNESASVSPMSNGPAGLSPANQPPRAAAAALFELETAAESARQQLGPQEGGAATSANKQQTSGDNTTAKRMEAALPVLGQLSVDDGDKKRRAMSLLPQIERLTSAGLSGTADGAGPGASGRGPSAFGNASDLAPPATNSPFLGESLQQQAPRRRSAMGNLMSSDIAPAAATLELRLASRKNRVKLTDLHPITFINDKEFLNSMSSLKKAGGTKLNAIFNSPVGRRLSVNAEMAQHSPFSQPKSGIKIGLTGYVYIDQKNGFNNSNGVLGAGRSRPPTKSDFGKGQFRRPSLAPNFWRTSYQQQAAMNGRGSIGAGLASDNIAPGQLPSAAGGYGNSGETLLLPSPVGSMRPRAASYTPATLVEDISPSPAPDRVGIGGDKNARPAQSANPIEAPNLLGETHAWQQGRRSSNVFGSDGYVSAYASAASSSRRMSPPTTTPAARFSSPSSSWALADSRGAANFKPPAGYHLDKRRTTMALLERLSEASIEVADAAGDNRALGGQRSQAASGGGHQQTQQQQQLELKPRLSLDCGVRQRRKSSVSCMLKIGEDEELKSGTRGDGAGRGTSTMAAGSIGAPLPTSNSASSKELLAGQAPIGAQGSTTCKGLTSGDRPKWPATTKSDAARQDSSPSMDRKTATGSAAAKKARAETKAQRGRQRKGSTSSAGSDDDDDGQDDENQEEDDEEGEDDDGEEGDNHHCQVDSSGSSSDDGDIEKLVAQYSVVGFQIPMAPDHNRRESPQQQQQHHQYQQHRSDQQQTSHQFKQSRPASAGSPSSSPVERTRRQPHQQHQQQQQYYGRSRSTCNSDRVVRNDMIIKQLLLATNAASLTSAAAAGGQKCFGGNERILPSEMRRFSAINLYQRDDDLFVANSMKRPPTSQIQVLSTLPLLAGTLPVLPASVAPASSLCAASLISPAKQGTLYKQLPVLPGGSSNPRADGVKSIITGRSGLASVNDPTAKSASFSSAPMSLSSMTMMPNNQNKQQQIVRAGSISSAMVAEVDVEEQLNRLRQQERRSLAFGAYSPLGSFSTSLSGPVPTGSSGNNACSVDLAHQRRFSSVLVGATDSSRWACDQATIADDDELLGTGTRGARGGSVADCGLGDVIVPSNLSIPAILQPPESIAAQKQAEQIIAQHEAEQRRKQQQQQSIGNTTSVCPTAAAQIDLVLLEGQQQQLWPIVTSAAAKIQEQPLVASLTASPASPTLSPTISPQVVPIQVQAATSSSASPSLAGGGGSGSLLVGGRSTDPLAYSGSKSCEPFKQLDTIIEGRGLLLGAKQQADPTYANKLRRLSGNHSRQSSLSANGGGGNAGERQRVDEDNWCKCDLSSPTRKWSTRRRLACSQSGKAAKAGGRSRQKQSESKGAPKLDEKEGEEAEEGRGQEPTTPSVVSSSSKFVLDTVKSLARRTLNNLATSMTPAASANILRDVSSFGSSFGSVSATTTTDRTAAGASAPPPAADNSNSHHHNNGGSISFDSGKFPGPRLPTVSAGANHKARQQRSRSMVASTGGRGNGAGGSGNGGASSPTQPTLPSQLLREKVRVDGDQIARAKAKGSVRRHKRRTASIGLGDCEDDEDQDEEEDDDDESEENSSATTSASSCSADSSSDSDSSDSSRSSSSALTAASQGSSATGSPDDSSLISLDDAENYLAKNKDNKMKRGHSLDSSSSSCSLSSVATLPCEANLLDDDLIEGGSQVAEKSPLAADRQLDEQQDGGLHRLTDGGRSKHHRGRHDGSRRRHRHRRNRDHKRDAVDNGEHKSSPNHAHGHHRRHRGGKKRVRRPTGADVADVVVKGAAGDDEFEEPKTCYKCDKKIRMELPYQDVDENDDDDDDGDDDEQDYRERIKGQEAFGEQAPITTKSGGPGEEQPAPGGGGGAICGGGGKQPLGVSLSEVGPAGSLLASQNGAGGSIDGAKSHKSQANNRAHHGRRRGDGARRSASMNAADQDMTTTANNNQQQPGAGGSGGHINRRKNKWHIQRNLAPKLKRQRSFSANYAPEVPNPVMPPPRRFSAAPTLICPHRNKSSSHSSSSLHHTYSIDSSESMITVIPANRGHEFKRTSRGSLSCNSGQGIDASGSFYALPRSPVSPRSPSRCSPGLLTPNTSEPPTAGLTEPPFSPATTTCSSVGLATVIQHHQHSSSHTSSVPVHHHHQQLQQQQQLQHQHSVASSSTASAGANRSTSKPSCELLGATNNTNSSTSNSVNKIQIQSSFSTSSERSSCFNLTLPGSDIQADSRPNSPTKTSANPSVISAEDEANMSLAVENGTSYNSTRNDLLDEFGCIDAEFQTDVEEDDTIREFNDAETGYYNYTTSTTTTAATTITTTTNITTTTTTTTSATTTTTSATTTAVETTVLARTGIAPIASTASTTHTSATSNSSGPIRRPLSLIDPNAPIIRESINEFCARHSREELEFLVGQVGYLRISDCYFSERSSTLCMVIEIKER